MTQEEIDARITRGEHQKQLARRRRLVRKRRQRRVRRVHMLRSIQTTRFWIRTLLVGMVCLFIAFWARYAYVYDVPTYAQRGALTGVNAYITKKSWLFGPPVFDLSRYESVPINPLIHDKYTILIHNLGRYQSVLNRPNFIWVHRQ